MIEDNNVKSNNIQQLNTIKQIKGKKQENNQDSLSLVTVKSATSSYFHFKNQYESYRDVRISTFFRYIKAVYESFRYNAINFENN